MSIKLERLTTEQRNPNTMNLDQMSALEIVTSMNQEDRKVPIAIEENLPKIACIAQWASEAITNGGRLIYIGAGTSGRLGVLDASECPPTFGVDSGLVVGVIAGGEKALKYAVEGAEDDNQLCEQDLKSLGLTSKDVVVGIAASGRTPYVVGGLKYAKSLGCRTASIACSANAQISKYAQIAVEVITGPEVLTGSTRLKAGTAQKLILNMISTSAMVLSGKSYENLMVDVVQSNEKLKERGKRIVCEATGVSEEEAERVLSQADGSCKLAITMILGDMSKDKAMKRLEQAKGHVRQALVDHKKSKGVLSL